MINLLTPRKSRPIKVAALVTRVADAVRSVVAPQTLFTTPVPAPAAVDPDTTEFFTEQDMPPAEDIAEAARLYFRACDDARTADRAKRKAKGLLGKLRAGRYGDWEVYREPSNRPTVDLVAVRKIFKDHNLGPVPMRQSADSLKVRKVELDLGAETVEAELSILAGAR